jgi:fibronectin-binding autotransporter adhesin
MRVTKHSATRKLTFDPRLNGISRSIGAVVFGTNNGGVTITAQTTSNTLTLNSSAAAIQMLAGSGNSTIATTLVSGTTQTWRNSSSNLLTISGSVSTAYQIVLDGQLAGNSFLFSGPISGAGRFTTVNGGIFRLTGNNTYDGPTTVNAGRFVVNGTHSIAAGGTYAIKSGATISGTGNIGRTVSVEDGGILAPGDVVSGTNQAGLLTISNTLSLSSSSSVIFDLAGNTSVVDDENSILGDLVLDGVLTVNQLAGFGVGNNYLLFSYSGSLTNNGLLVSPLGGEYTGSIDTTTSGFVYLNVIPEPNVAVLAFVGLAGVFFWRNKKAQLR